MFVTTKGIILRTYPFKENKIICKIFTEEKGLVSFIAKKNKEQIILSQALNIVEITYKCSNTYSLFFVSECSADYVYTNLLSNGRKLSYAMIICEILNKCINNVNVELFNFIISSFKWLDSSRGEIKGFEILFLIKFCRLNGIQPLANNVSFKAPYKLDLFEGKYTNDIQKETLKYKISCNESAEIYNLSKLEFNNLHGNNISILNPNKILEHIVKYISIHLSDISNLNSIKILKELN